MNRQSLILAAALLLVPLTAPAGESIQLVDVKTTKAGHEQVWIRLQPHQARALRLKHRVSKRQTRWSGQDKHRAAPIELDSAQRLALRKALRVRRPYQGKVIIWLVWSELKISEKGRVLQVVRDADQFRQARPSDPQPRS